MTTLPLYELPAEPDAQAAAMGVWARGRIAEARGLLISMASKT